MNTTDLNEFERLVTKWDKTGLLEGANIWQKIKLAQLLDEAANQLVERSKTSQHNEILAGLVLPAVRRKFERSTTDFSVKEMIGEIESQLPTLEFRLDKLKDLFPTTWKKYEQELETEFLNELFYLQ